MDTELIQFKNVTKRFGNNTVLDSINLAIPENKITGILGASGEGKTTILKLLIGFYKPTSGEVLYLRRKIMKEREDVGKYFGFATEDGSFYEKLTVIENIFHFGRLYGIKKEEIQKRANEILEFIGLRKAANTLAENLSVGMKKRLDIACALIQKPAVMVLDEPTADLDPVLREQMLKLIKRINKQGATIIMTTQLMSEADRICDKVAFLYSEKIVEEGSPEKIKAKYGAKHLHQVFEKIFSKKSRKVYSEPNNIKSQSEDINSDKVPVTWKPEEIKKNEASKETGEQENIEESKKAWTRVTDFLGKTKETDNSEKDSLGDGKNDEPI
jgi:ABC-2 type transport system ATP-binding protein